MDSPTDAITEGISQHCIVQKAISTNRVLDLIEYLKEVSSRCVEYSKTNILGCSQAIREEEGNFIILENELQSCISRNSKIESDFYGNQVIQFLEDQKALSDYYTYRSVPSIFIQEELVRGIVQGDLAAGAVCDSFVSPPESCKGLHLKTMTKVYKALTVTHDDLESKKKSGSFWVVLFCLLLFVLSYVVFQRMVSKQISNDLESRVNYTLTQYHRVRDGDGDSGTHKPVNVQNTSMETEGGISSNDSGL